jgi:hypothetical protein
MTRDDIIRLAREAHREVVTKDYKGHAGQLDPWTMRLLERFAALVVERERDAVCQIILEWCICDANGEEIVSAIRARGEGK